MSYGSIDGGSFGGRNPFGGPLRQGYQPVGKEKHVAMETPRRAGRCRVEHIPQEQLHLLFAFTAGLTLALLQSGILFLSDRIIGLFYVAATDEIAALQSVIGIREMMSGRISNLTSLQ